MAKYIICPYCGDHLDHGERCNCQNDKSIEKNSDARIIKYDYRNRTKKIPI
jgi:hypothetical protein